MEQMKHKIIEINGHSFSWQPFKMTFSRNGVDIPAGDIADSTVIAGNLLSGDTINVHMLDEGDDDPLQQVCNVILCASSRAPIALSPNLLIHCLLCQALSASAGPSNAGFSSSVMTGL